MPYEYPQDEADLLVLGLEFDNDPAEIGYPAGGAENTANDVPFADAINETREDVQVKRRSVATSEIAGAIDPSAHEALSAEQARWLHDCVLSIGTLDALTATAAVGGLNERFPDQTATGSRIRSLLTRSGTRLEQMQQLGLLSRVDSFTVSTPGNIRAARAAQ